MEYEKVLEIFRKFFFLTRGPEWTATAEKLQTVESARIKNSVKTRFMSFDTATEDLKKIPS